MPPNRLTLACSPLSSESCSGLRLRRACYRRGAPRAYSRRRFYTASDVTGCRQENKDGLTLRSRLFFPEQNHVGDILGTGDGEGLSIRRPLKFANVLRSEVGD